MYIIVINEKGHESREIDSKIESYDMNDKRQTSCGQQ